jgi:hypothetical protein
MIITDSQLQQSATAKSSTTISIEQSQTSTTVQIKAGSGAQFLSQLQSAAGIVDQTEQTSEAEAAMDQAEQIKQRLFAVLYAALEQYRNALANEAAGCDCSSTQSAASSMPVSTQAVDGGDYSQGRVQRSAATNMLGMVRIEQVVMETHQQIDIEDQLDYTAAGQVLTSDGRSIDFDLSLMMSQYTSLEQSERYEQTIVFKDPLILNLDGEGVDISDQRFEFDLDQDAQMDWIPLLVEGNGFLARDINQDGIINDGSELFGTLSGDGFGDLALLDDDQNGFIDEADSAFDDLMVWIKTDERDVTYSLAEAGIGAMSVEGMSGDFAIRDQYGQEQAMIRETGVYLRESGEVGVLQQVDFATETGQDDTSKLA